MTEPRKALCECRCPGEAKCPKAECRAGGCIMEREAEPNPAQKMERLVDFLAAYGVTAS